MSSPLKQLVEIISSGVETLQSAYDKNGVPFPSLNDPFVPTPMDTNIEVNATAQLIAAAAFQIIAIVRTPMDTLQDYAPAMYTSGALAVVVNANVADILKTAGPQGMHAKDIAVKAEMESAYLARVIRYLAVRHVFREVTPNMFANNRISSLLVKGKTLQEIQADPEGQYDEGPGAAFVGHTCDEGLMSAAKMSQFLRDPKGAASPFNMSLGRPTRLWSWFEEPGNTWRGRRFNAAVKGGPGRFPSWIFTDGLDWKSIKNGSVVVDIGGGIGSATLILAKAFPHLRYVVQDLDKVVMEAYKFWKTTYPEAIAAGLVSLQSHDFFRAQPVKDAAVYFMRVVLHDWPEAEVRKILQNTRGAAGPSSKLVVFEMLIPYACENPEGSFVNSPPVPAPLVPNTGPGMAGFSTMADIQMLNLLGGQERTLEEFTNLGQATGWKLEGVKSGPLVAILFSAA